MKSKADMDDVQKCMQPGLISAAGFLGLDERGLEAILLEDAVEVRRLGLDHGQIARRMRHLGAVGARGLGGAVRVGSDLEVRVECDRGGIPCPFGHEGVFPKTTVTVKNVTTGREVTFTELNIHLIEEHGFYEGRGSVYRQEPAVLAEVLGV